MIQANIKFATKNHLLKFLLKQLLSEPS